jgi:hypothetical protein
MELVVESQPIFSYDRYDMCVISIFESSNPALIEKRTHLWARKHPPTHLPIQNENDEEEKWYTDIENYHIQDAVDLNMDEIEDEIDV